MINLFVNAIPIHPGGGLTVLLGLLSGLRKADCPLHITVGCSAPKTRQALLAAGTADQVEMFAEQVGAGRAFVWQNTQLGRVLRRIPADLLLGFNHYTMNVPCRQVVYHLNLRRFSREHRTLPWNERLQERVRDWSAGQALRRADMNVFESKFLQEAARNSAGKLTGRHRVVYIGLPDDMVDRATLLADRYDGAPRLLTVTSHVEHKDNPTLMRTVAELVRRAPHVPWHLDIVGGQDADAWLPYRKMAADLEIQDRITWHGYCEHDRLNQLLDRSLCLIATSQMESFAMVALEAMARRCPPIVARIAAMPESVGDAGLLVTPGSAANFADAVSHLYETPARRTDLVARGLQWIQAFRWSTCGQDFSQIFSHLAATQAAA